MANSEIRRHKVRQFVTVPKDLAREKGKFEKEIGIYARILALPECKSTGEDFDFSVEGYCRYYDCGQDAIYKGLDNLVKRGWIERTRERNEKGQYSKVIYDLLPDKAEAPQEENPHRENPNVENPNRENREQKKNLIKEDSKKRRSSSHTHTSGEFDDLEERQVQWFAKAWNEKCKANPDSRTAMITSLTDQRRQLILDIFAKYDREGIVRHDLIERGIRNAMTSKRAQGLNKGQIAPAEVEYMLRNFVKLVEGTF